MAAHHRTQFTVWAHIERERLTIDADGDILEEEYRDSTEPEPMASFATEAEAVAFVASRAAFDAAEVA